MEAYVYGRMNLLIQGLMMELNLGRLSSPFLFDIELVCKG